MQGHRERAASESDAKENMMSLGEQHLFFRHQRDPIGFPRKTEFYPLQCSTCEWFFPVQRILDSHVQNCDGAEGRKQAAKNGGKEKNNNDGVCANKNVAVVSKAASTAARAPKAASIAKNASMAVTTVGKVSAKYFSSAANKENGKIMTNKEKPSVNLTAMLRAALKQHNLQPCHVRLMRSAEVELFTSNRKWGEEEEVINQPAKKRKKYAKTVKAKSVEQESSPPSNLLSLGNKWWENDTMESGFSCPLCKTRPLSKPVYIEDHVAAHHFKQKRYVCVICRDVDEKEQHSWSHKTTLDEHLKKQHAKEFKAKDKSGKKLTEVTSLLPDVVNVMRLFFKIYPRKGERIKEEYLPKKIPYGQSDGKSKKTKCPECDQKFYADDPRTVIDHIMWRHRDAPRYHCAHCNDGTGFGMVAGFEDHCKKEHGCDKVDYLRLLFMQVDLVSSDLIEDYGIDEEYVDSMHEERVVVSEDGRNVASECAVTSWSGPSISIMG